MLFTELASPNSPFGQDNDIRARRQRWVPALFVHQGKTEALVAVMMENTCPGRSAPSFTVS